MSIFQFKQPTIDITNVKTRVTGSICSSFCNIIADYGVNERVGYAYINVEGKVATLADIKVYENYFMGKVFCIKKTFNFRGHGIGSMLLKQVIYVCKQAGVHEIQGSMHGDVEKLEKWYKRHGFEVNGNLIILKFVS